MADDFDVEAMLEAPYKNQIPMLQTASLPSQQVLEQIRVKPRRLCAWQGHLPGRTTGNKRKT